MQSCSLITTEANALMTPIHDRMPVILDPAGCDQWLDRPRHPKDSPGGALEPVDDPCHNLLNWEEWHECDVIRAEVEKAMAIR